MIKLTKRDKGIKVPGRKIRRVIGLAMALIFLFTSTGALTFNALSFDLIVKVDEEIKEVKTTAKTVGEMLERENITINSNDEVVPNLDTELTDDMRVDVLRVEYIIREVKEEIPFKTEIRYSSAMLKSNKKVIQEGETGIKTVTYKDKLVNGEVKSSEIEKEIITEEPITEIIIMGTIKDASKLGNTKVQKHANPISELVMPDKYTIGEDNIPIDYKHKITGRAAAYYEPGGKTATGKSTMPGRVAVNPKQIPYGSELWVVSDDGIVYGYAVAEDTGGFAKKGYFTIDLYMNSKWQCCQWGNRKVTIYVLN